MPPLSPPRHRPAAVRPAVPDILLEHLEEQAFLWVQRRRLLFATDVPLRRLAAHDARIAAHQDALRIGGDTTVAVAEPLLGEGDPFLAASALWAWLTLAAPSPAAAFARLEGQPPTADATWCEALRAGSAKTRAHLFPAETAARLPARPLALALGALALDRDLPPALVALAARHADAGVRAALARVLAWPGTGSLAAEHLDLLAADSDPAVRRRARWSRALRDPAGTCAWLRAARPTQLDAFDTRMLGLLGEPGDARVLARLAETEALQGAALLALGDLGTHDAVETLLRVLAVPDDAVQVLATVALERALGGLAPEPGDPPAATALTAAQARWQQVAEQVGDAPACCRGYARPWAGDPAEEPAWWTWRRALTAPTVATRRWQLEVPDGFWAAEDALVSEAGA